MLGSVLLCKVSTWRRLTDVKLYRASAHREMEIVFPDDVSEDEVRDEIIAMLFYDGDWANEFEYSEITQEDN